FAAWPYQFHHAWQSGYTYALTPAPSNQISGTSPSDFIAADAKSNQAMSAMAAVNLNESKPSNSLPTGSEYDNIVTQPALSERIVNYHIQVSLNEELHQLEGEQIVTWRNPGKKQVDDLY